MLTPTLKRKLLKRTILGNERKLALKGGLIDFSSNDILGLSHRLNINPKRWGSTGSRLLLGNSKEAEILENNIARFHGGEAGLLFNSGYTANLGLLSAVAHPKDRVLYDEYIHASTRDGIRLSQAESYHFLHNDMKDLERLLCKETRSGSQVYLCVESLYSCDGSLAPLKSITELCAKYNCLLIVDEAHSTGIYGPRGEGRVFEENLTSKVFARVHTFSKSLGVFGAIVIGSQQLKEFLINFCRPFIYSTALPYPILEAIQQAYGQLSHMQEERHHLRRLIDFFLSFKEQHKIKFYHSETHIQSLSTPGNQAAKDLGSKFEKNGYDLRPLLSPTVPAGEERLRICLHSFNTFKNIENFFNLLETLYD